MKIKFNGQVMTLPTTNVIDDTHSSPNSTWSSQKIEGSLSEKSDLAHIHDDRYYTKSQTESKLEEKLDVSGGTLTGNLDFNVNGAQASVIPTDESFALRQYQDRDLDYYSEISVGDGGINYAHNSESGFETYQGLHTGNMATNDYQKIINTTESPNAGDASTYPDGTLIVVYE